MHKKLWQFSSSTPELEIVFLLFVPLTVRKSESFRHKRQNSLVFWKAELDGVFYWQKKLIVICRIIKCEIRCFCPFTTYYFKSLWSVRSDPSKTVAAAAFTNKYSCAGEFVSQQSSVACVGARNIKNRKATTCSRLMRRHAPHVLFV